MSRPADPPDEVLVSQCHIKEGDWLQELCQAGSPVIVLTAGECQAWVSLCVCVCVCVRVVFVVVVVVVVCVCLG